MWHVRWDLHVARFARLESGHSKLTEHYKDLRGLPLPGKLRSLECFSFSRDKLSQYKTEAAASSVRLQAEEDVESMQSASIA